MRIWFRWKVISVSAVGYFNLRRSGNNFRPRVISQGLVQGGLDGAEFFLVQEGVASKQDAGLWHEFYSAPYRADDYWSALFVGVNPYAIILHPYWVWAIHTRINLYEKLSECIVHRWTQRYYITPLQDVGTTNNYGNIKKPESLSSCVAIAETRAWVAIRLL